MEKLQAVLQALATEEYANGSGKTAVQIEKLLRKDFFSKLSAEELASEIYDIYEKDRMDCIDSGMRFEKERAEREAHDKWEEEQYAELRRVNQMLAEDTPVEVHPDDRD